MKAYTNLEQSKKMAEILPIESADMFWLVVGNTPRVHVLTEPLSNYSHWENYSCWSLAALLEIIKKPTVLDLLIDGRGCRCHCRDKQEGKFYGTDDYCDTPIDACVEMIIKLHKRNLL